MQIVQAHLPDYQSLLGFQAPSWCGFAQGQGRVGLAAAIPTYEAILTQPRQWCTRAGCNYSLQESTYTVSTKSAIMHAARSYNIALHSCLVAYKYSC